MKMRLRKIMATNNIPTMIYDDVISTDDSTVTIGATGASGTSYSTIGSTISWNGVSGQSNWNINSNVTYSTTPAYTIGTGVGVNGTFSITQPTIKIDVEDGKKCIISTPKNKIDIDELAEMITLMKSLLVAVASDEDFANRNPALAEAAHDMLINKLKG